MVNVDPPIFVIAVTSALADVKDTLRNFVESQDCVRNVVSEGFVEVDNATSIDAPYGVTEWAVSALTPAFDRQTVKCARIRESVSASRPNPRALTIWPVLGAELLSLADLDDDDHEAEVRTSDMARADTVNRARFLRSFGHETYLRSGMLIDGKIRDIMPVNADKISFRSDVDSHARRQLLKGRCFPPRRCASPSPDLSPPVRAAQNCPVCSPWMAEGWEVREEMTQDPVAQILATKCLPPLPGDMLAAGPSVVETET
ncbi:hypothetical protein NM208_g14023 [Fusarium decemcellulare]|uniref:Uncharacterized protein n=1 Tax=Fusarium decemcellulare TaxID=57161 RepID=A0ACC1RHM5_9HYPO|nr:hypothetical protein NM208_g14023 [Fusarium decemcellulare]